MAGISEDLKEILKKLMLKSQFNRDDDYALYADYINYKLPEKKSSEYYEVMQNHAKYFIYSIKTVERTRRLIQQEARENGDERLMSSKQVEEYRKKLAEEYKAAFVGG